MNRVLPLFLLVTACSSGDELPPWLWGELDVQVDPAFDPKLDGDPRLTITVTNTAEGLAHIGEDGIARACDFAVEARHASGLVVPLEAHAAPTPLNSVQLTWDGRGDDGLPVDPGVVQIVADLYCNERQQGFGEARTHIVRLAPATIDVSTVDPADFVPLAWHKTDLRTRDFTVLDEYTVEWKRRAPGGSQSALDADDGTPRPAPEPYTRGDVPPWGPDSSDDLDAMNLPLGVVAGAPLALIFTPGETAVSAHSHAAIDAAGPLAGRTELPPIRIVADGADNDDDVGWVPGRGTTVSGIATARTLGLQHLTVTWRFEAFADGEWAPIAGFVETEHEVWALAGPTQVTDGTADGASPAASWIGVLQDLAPAVQDLPADDPVAVMSALRDHLNGDPWIIYNPGDSAYSTYEGRYIYWDRIWLDMGDWLDRDSGIDLYCHSLACLLSSQANHLGIETEYITIVDERHPTTGQRFTTRLTRAAGTTNWRQWTFNSHGITRFDGLVWDAAVDVDGDEAPTELPATPVSPKELSFDEYMAILTAHDMIIVNHGRCDNY